MQELEDAVAEVFEPSQYQLLSRSADTNGEYRAFGFTSTIGDKPDIAEWVLLHACTSATTIAPCCTE